MGEILKDRKSLLPSPRIRLDDFDGPLRATPDLNDPSCGAVDPAGRARSRFLSGRPKRSRPSRSRSRGSADEKGIAESPAAVPVCSGIGFEESKMDRNIRLCVCLCSFGLLFAGSGGAGEA